MRKISVIIPCYNVADYIDKCLISITAQTIGVETLEIICVDDGSIDDTWEHLRKWEKMFPDNILLIRQPVNRRQGAARNLGVQYASAEWIAFVDADDWLEFDYFQKLYEPVTKFECDVVSCGTMRDMSELDACYDERNREPGGEYHLVIDSKDIRGAVLRYKLMGIGPAAKIIRKKLLIENAIFFPEDLAYEDHYWVPLLYLYTTNIYIIEEKLYHYFGNPQSTTLAKDKDYHVDCITIQMMKWEDYKRRGLLERYKEMLEYDIIWYAVISMNMIILYRSKPPFSLFQLEKNIIRQQIPDHQRVIGQYMQEFSGKNRILLQALYSPVNKDEFYQIVQQIKD